jgi:hypothetical protein
VDFLLHRLDPLHLLLEAREHAAAVLEPPDDAVGDLVEPLQLRGLHAPGQKKSRWVAETDLAALDIDLVEVPGQSASADPSGPGAGPTTTLTYKILGRKVDVRLASRRSENLTARVLTRIPAGLPNVPHASLTHLGGGDQQNDPQDQTGTRVQAPVFEVRLRLENADLKYLPGQRAYVRFTMEKDQPLLAQWMRKFWQLIQTQSAQNKWM